MTLSPAPTSAVTEQLARVEPEGMPSAHWGVLLLRREVLRREISRRRDCLAKVRCLLAAERAQADYDRLSGTVPPPECVRRIAATERAESFIAERMLEQAGDLGQLNCEMLWFVPRRSFPRPS
jgi:hypothetical protein